MHWSYVVLELTHWYKPFNDNIEDMRSVVPLSIIHIMGSHEPSQA